MPLSAGNRLGPYEILSPLGAGGMGEVYRAHDTRLARDVAIKILASHLSSSPELKQRMEREARAISALNHPNICHLYDIGSHDGTDFLVMEFLEGETLASRLHKGALPLGEIYKISIAIADALAIAHRQGIVHRDLKPGNIMLTPGGAKLMDFGLAKPLSTQPTGGSSSSLPSFTAAATLSGPSPLTPLTSAGTIIGTIQYMSPEQIEGKEADVRSDIFALGAVLYEMTTGNRPFEGKSQISLASAILENTPPAISTVVRLAPPAFEHIVMTCLQKNPEERYQTAHDIKLELQWIAGGGSAPAAAPVTAPRMSISQRLIWGAALVAVLAGGILAGFFLKPLPPAQHSIRTVINPPEKTTLNLTGDFAGPPVLSPDGRSIAFTAVGSDGKSQIWVRLLNMLEAHALPDTIGAFFPFWSPDSRSLAFFADGKLKTVDLEGGSAQTVCDVALGRGGAWGAGGVILFSPNPSAPIFQINATGGTPAPITKLDADKHTSHRWPFFLPDGKHFLYVAINHDSSKSANDAVYYASLDGRENKLLFHSQSSVVYAGRFLLFGRGNELLAQPFDPSSGTLSGDARTVATGVMNDVSTWHVDASASNDGALVFGSGGNADLQLVWMDRASKQLTPVADKLGNVEAAAISPQGDRIALQINSGANDIWSLDLTRGVRTRLTFGPVANNSPLWSPDGKWIAYVSLRGGKWQILRKLSDGSGSEELLFSDDRQIVPTDWSHDGKYIIYMRSAPQRPSTFEVQALPLAGEHKPILLVPDGTAARLSPDGRWLAYMSAESGGIEVYVVPFGGGQGKWQVSASGGQNPSWSRDGKELYYADSVFNVYAVAVKANGDALQFGTPQPLVTGWSTPPVFFYSVAPDSKKILLDRVSQQVNQSITVVSNFREGLSNK